MKEATNPEDFPKVAHYAVVTYKTKSVTSGGYDGDGYEGPGSRFYQPGGTTKYHWTENKEEWEKFLSKLYKMNIEFSAIIVNKVVTEVRIELIFT